MHSVHPAIAAVFGILSWQRAAATAFCLLCVNANGANYTFNLTQIGPSATFNTVTSIYTNANLVETSSNLPIQSSYSLIGGDSITVNVQLLEPITNVPGQSRQVSTIFFGSSNSAVSPGVGLFDTQTLTLRSDGATLSTPFIPYGGSVGTTVGGFVGNGQGAAPLVFTSATFFAVVSAGSTFEFGPTSPVLQSLTLVPEPGTSTLFAFGLISMLVCLNIHTRRAGTSRPESC